ncbi:MAG: hypothetical protein IJT96_03290 [Lachnospiraceae bacterium]|nr:hypothetical protein [Lachnospiraceae bacterium]
MAKDPIKYQEDVEVQVTITIGISPYVAGTTIIRYNLIDTRYSLLANKNPAVPEERWHSREYADVLESLTF